jgi:FixJ family two-component response regulator
LAILRVIDGKVVSVCHPRIEPLPQISVVSIVDDDEAVGIAMSSLVRSLGYEAAVFTSAEDFLASPHLHDTSCLIVDVQMPGMSGLDLQDELHARGNRIPMIFITAFPEERFRQRAEAAGAVGFFRKPVDGDGIISCLEAAMRHD